MLRDARRADANLPLPGLRFFVGRSITNVRHHRDLDLRQFSRLRACHHGSVAVDFPGGEREA